MFDIEKFKEYVGPISGTNYVSGLRSIESLFGEDIEAEYLRDRCASLLAKVTERKNDDTLSAKDKKRASDIHSHLKKYVEFRGVQDGIITVVNTNLSEQTVNCAAEFDKNIILYGPPGTGKTYNTVVYAVAIIESETKTLNDVLQEPYDEVFERFNAYKAQGKIGFTTFHQSYGYEEFIEGIKPAMSEGRQNSEPSGDIRYDVESGVFKKFCEEPADNEKSNRVFIIDEINRGNISKILGELITLIEPSKRVGQDEEMQAILPYSKKPFGVPDNVYIIGTMNTADRSIAAVDTALRRRFSFKEMPPQPRVVQNVNVGGISVSDMLSKMNERIEVLYDREHTIGHAYFTPLLKDACMQKLADIFKNKIIPLLQEYFYEDYQKIRLVLGDNQTNNKNMQFITTEKIDIGALFGASDYDFDVNFKYKINDDAFGNKNAYIKIYNSVVEQLQSEDNQSAINQQ